jgi:hypothetical protein
MMGKFPEVSNFNGLFLFSNSAVSYVTSGQLSFIVQEASRICVTCELHEEEGAKRQQLPYN